MLTVKTKGFRVTQTTSPDSQLLLNLRCLQDVDKVFQVVQVLGPGQLAAHRAHNLHRS